MTPEAFVERMLLEHPVGARLDDIAHAGGLDRREVEAAVQLLRIAGRPIVSGPWGIRLARTADEAEEGYRSLRSRALTQLQTARAMRSTWRRMRQEEDARRHATLWPEGDVA